MADRDRERESDRDRQEAIKEPDEWVTGDEPMTAAQESYLHTLARQAGEQASSGLTKRDAAKKIEELQERTGRGQ